jgi:hypothetical protein
MKRKRKKKKRKRKQKKKKRKGKPKKKRKVRGHQISRIVKNVPHETVKNCSAHTKTRTATESDG